MSDRRKTVLAISGLFVAVVLLGAYFGGLLPLQIVSVPVDTETKSHIGGGWRGEGYFAGGGSTDSGINYRELLQDDEYVASWASDFLGQLVTYEGKYTGNDLLPCVGEAWRYKVEVNTGTGWGVVADQNGPSGNIAFLFGWYVAPAATFQLKNEPHGSGLRVSMWVKCHDLFAEWEEGKDVRLLAVDEARILGGIGTVQWSKQIYEVGETASLNVRVPYVTDGEGHGWKVTIFSTAQNRIVFEDFVRAEVSSIPYVTTTADFSSASGCRNELQAILTNEIFDKSFDAAAVVDASALSPSVTITGVNPSQPKQGETFTVTWTTTPNPQTGSKIEKIVVRYGWNDPREVVLPGTATTYSFVMGQAGTLHVEVIAYDGGCRPALDEVYVSVNEPPNEGGPGGGFAFPIWAGLVLAAVAISVVAVLVRQIPIFPWKLLLIMVSAILALVAILIYPR